MRKNVKKLSTITSNWAKNIIPWKRCATIFANWLANKRSELKHLEKKLTEHLAVLYGEDNAGTLTDRFLDLLDSFQAQNPAKSQPMPSEMLTERDAILITYGDMVQEPNESPLHTLSTFLQKHLSEFVNSIHILPFYPSSGRY